MLSHYSSIYRHSHLLLNSMNNNNSSPSPPTITLRPFRLTDADDLLKWAGDDRVTRRLRWKTITSKEEALTFIEQVCIPHPWRRSICIEDRSIGFVSVFPGSGNDRCRADIGYSVRAEHWGRGIATQAVKMAVAQVFDDFPHLLRLQAFVDVENKASQRVLEKAGFLKEACLRKYSYLKGNLKDLFLYSFLSTDSILLPLPLPSPPPPGAAAAAEENP